MWTLDYKHSALKELKALPPSMQKRVNAGLDRLAENPFHPGLDVKKLKGDGRYRLRVGDYRVFYELQRNILIIYVVEVAHRKEAY